jgi:hypothetical protein
MIKQLIKQGSVVFFVLAASLAMAQHEQKAQATLKVGDPAPRLEVLKWVKGEPIQKFEKGRVYVINVCCGG